MYNGLLINYSMNHKCGLFLSLVLLFAIPATPVTPILPLSQIAPLSHISPLSQIYNKHGTRRQSRHCRSSRCGNSNTYPDCILRCNDRKNYNARNHKGLNGFVEYNRDNNRINKRCDKGHYKEGNTCFKCPSSFTSKEGSSHLNSCYKLEFEKD